MRIPVAPIMSKADDAWTLNPIIQLNWRIDRACLGSER